MASQFAPASAPRRRSPIRRSTVATALALVALCAAGCEPRADSATDDVTIELAFDPPARVGNTTCTVRLSDVRGGPLAGARLELEGNMNHAGMVPVFATPAEVEVGRYEAPFEFTMGGDWFVIVSGELADGRALERVVHVDGVRAESTGDEPAACCQTSASQ